MGLSVVLKTVDMLVPNIFHKVSIQENKIISLNLIILENYID